MATAAYGALPFREQSEFFRRKLNLPTDGWTDIYTREHDYAFVVAGANRDAIVADFRVAVTKAIDEGQTLEGFRKDFDRIVAKHGWEYNGSRNWRSGVIYKNNLATSRAAGRWKQLQAAPFWQYDHLDIAENPRPQHQAWDGLVLAREDPAWQVMFPPNGWGCHCQVRGVWPRDLERMGKDGPDPSPEFKYVERTIGQRSINGPRTVRVPEGIDPGFDYAPGASRLRSAIPPERPNPPIHGSTGGPGLPNRRPVDALPPARRVPASSLLPTGLPPEDYARAFLELLGATLEKPAVFEDVVGERLVVGKELFTNVKGVLKADKRGRGPFMALLAMALQSPDEIWVRLEWLESIAKAVVRRRYVARFEVEGRVAPALAVFELGADGWTGVTAYHGDDLTDESWRVGALLYRRSDE